MRNQSADHFPKKYIAVLNASQSTDEDDVELLKDSVTLSSDNPVSSPLRLSADKPVYGNRSKVTLKLPELPGDLKDFSLSVVRRDCVLPFFPSAGEVQKEK